MDKKITDIYFMGIGGTAMGSLAGLLKSMGYKVRGSDKGVYSPMKETLENLNIDYKTPYNAQNLYPLADMVIVGNVIRKDNPENVALEKLNIPYESLPSFLEKYVLSNRDSLVVSGTHGKTTSSSLLAHTLHKFNKSSGFLIGGVLNNFAAGFLAPLENGPFVIEGDEYDTAYFDKQPKFMHYKPKFLLVTSIEFDHADIYQDLDAIINAFSKLFASMDSSTTIIANNECANIKKALKLSSTKANIFTYGYGGDFYYQNANFNKEGLKYEIIFQEKNLGHIEVPLYGNHNLMNSLGVYAMLYAYSVPHQEIKRGFISFLNVKRRMDEVFNKNSLAIIDDFAHHPTAVKETIKAAKQKYPDKKIVAIFEPRSATSCLKIFENDYVESLSQADIAIIAPVGRMLDKNLMIDTNLIAEKLKQKNILAYSFDNYDDLAVELKKLTSDYCFLCMSNGELGGLLKPDSVLFN